MTWFFGITGVRRTFMLGFGLRVHHHHHRNNYQMAVVARILVILCHLSILLFFISTCQKGNFFMWSEIWLISVLVWPCPLHMLLSIGSHKSSFVFTFLKDQQQPENNAVLSYDFLFLTNVSIHARWSDDLSKQHSISLRMHVPFTLDNVLCWAVIQ